MVIYSMATSRPEDAPRPWIPVASTASTWLLRARDVCASSSRVHAFSSPTASHPCRCNWQTPCAATTSLLGCKPRIVRRTAPGGALARAGPEDSGRLDPGTPFGLGSGPWPLHRQRSRPFACEVEKACGCSSRIISTRRRVRAALAECRQSFCRHGPHDFWLREIPRT